MVVIFKPGTNPAKPELQKLPDAILFLAVAIPTEPVSSPSSAYRNYSYNFFPHLGIYFRVTSSIFPATTEFPEFKTNIEITRWHLIYGSEKLPLTSVIIVEVLSPDAAPISGSPIASFHPTETLFVVDPFRLVSLPQPSLQRTPGNENYYKKKAASAFECF
jgi:hypothetical protein